ncbi:MAG: NACHT domain-containing protein [Chloroflexota bacterium]
MDLDLIEKLANAKTAEESQIVVLEMSLRQFSEALKQAVYAAAVPHWFDFKLLSALIGEEESDQQYDELVAQTFVNYIPGRGYTIHERTRVLLLRTLWKDNQNLFIRLSGLAAQHCAQRTSDSVSKLWQAEEIYHLLVSDPESGLEKFQAMATAWANFEQSSYEEIEYIAQLAQEHISSGRLSSQSAGWTQLWQARLALLYNRPNRAGQILQSIDQNLGDQLFKAEYLTTVGNTQSALGQEDLAFGAWQRAANIFEVINQPFDSYLVSSKIRPNAPQTLSGIEPPSPTSELPTFRDQLLDIIEGAWINGVLYNSLGVQKNVLNLPLDSSATEAGAARLIAHRPNGTDQLMTGSSSLQGLFEASGRSLLILGAPGSGKTITLLQLLEQLITAARLNEDNPIPLLFNLSSFGQHQGEFIDWLIEQAHDQYSLKRESSRDAFEQGIDYYLLFDGLDEIPDQNGRRSEAVNQINHFFNMYPAVGFVVCSRMKDYRELDSTLNVHHAVVIQPLTNQQIEDTFVAIGRDDLNTLAKNNWRLREALRSPLLVNLLPQVIGPTEVDQFATSTFTSIEDCKQAVFSRYAEKLVPEKDKKWLIYLATSMQQHGLSVFQIESLQPDWLPTKQLHGRYRRWAGGLLTTATGGGAGLVSWAVLPILVGLAYLTGNGINNSLPPFWQVVIALILYPLFAVPFGLYIGIAFGFGGATAARRTMGIENQSQKVILGGIIAWVATALLIGFLGLNMVQNFGTNLFNAMVFSAGFVFPISLLCGTDQIQFRDQVRFRWPDSIKFRKPVTTAGIITLALGFVGGLFGGTIETGEFWLAVQNFIPTFIEILPITIMTGLLCAFGLEVLDTPIIDERKRPGAGVTGSLKNAVYISSISLVIFGTSGYLLDAWYEADGQFLVILLFYIFPPIFAWYGGMAYTQHWAIRIVLARNSMLPLRLVSWLDSLSQAGLLRQVGGSYIFRHRSLLEHFSTD